MDGIRGRGPGARWLAATLGLGLLAGCEAEGFQRASSGAKAQAPCEDCRAWEDCVEDLCVMDRSARVDWVVAEAGVFAEEAACTPCGCAPVAFWDGIDDPPDPGACLEVDGWEACTPEARDTYQAAWGTALRSDVPVALLLGKTVRATLRDLDDDGWSPLCEGSAVATAEDLHAGRVVVACEPHHGYVVLELRP